jgi:PPOX class probable F420-dependent enzyme
MHHRAVTTTIRAEQRAFLEAVRTATLATIAPGGAPRLVPVCFVLGAGARPVLYIPLDEKPKDVEDPRELARVRDITIDPRVSLLIERWSEDWANLAWLRLSGEATLVEPPDGPGEHAGAVAALRAKYAQYATHRLDERPLIRIVVTGARSWGDLVLRRGVSE